MFSTDTGRPAGRVCSQRGDVLVEALIALLLVSFIGLGITFGASRAVISQRNANVYMLSVAQLRHQIDAQGLASGCPSTGTQTVVSSVELVAGADPASVTKTCTVQSNSVTIAGTRKAVSVPQIRFDLTGTALLGQGNTLVLRN